jgi:hypothetical protein
LAQINLIRKTKGKENVLKAQKGSWGKEGRPFLSIPETSHARSISSVSVTRFAPVLSQATYYRAGVGTNLFYSKNKR